MTPGHTVGTSSYSQVFIGHLQRTGHRSELGRESSLTGPGLMKFKFSWGVTGRQTSTCV